MRKIILAIIFFCTIIFISSQENIKSNIEQHLYAMASDNQNGRKAGSLDSKIVADYILEQFNEIGLKTEIQKFSFNDRFQNIIGIIPSNNDKYIVIGAHYDHLGKKFGTIYNVADDNASGVSAIIEISRILSKEKLQYGIVFVAFDAEEIGLRGSRYFANNNDYEIELMLSLDMVGHLNHEARLIYEGAGTIKNGEEYIENSEVDNISVKTYSVAKNSGVLTDTFHFSKKNIPAINVYTGIETSDYHLPTDDIETLDIDGIVSVTKQVSQFVIDIQNSLELSGINLYGNHQFSLGVSTTYFSKSSGDLISVFGMIPCSYSILGNQYIKMGLGYEFRKKEINSENIKYNSINIPVSFDFSTKILGLEIIIGWGGYGNIDLDSLANDDFEYEVGTFTEIILSQYDSVSLLNHLCLILEMKSGYLNFFDEGLLNHMYTPSLKIGYTF